MKIGLSRGQFTKQVFQDLKNGGIDCMEVSPSYADNDTLDFKGLKSLADEYGIELWSYHLRFGYSDQYDMAVFDDELRQSGIKGHALIMQKAADIGIKNFVIHPSGEPIAPQNRAKAIEMSKKSLSALCQIATRLGCTLCVEDLPRTCLGNCSDEILDLISADSNLKVCFDVNHLLNEGTFDFLHKVKDKLQTLHISDYDFIDEKHWLPGEGKIEWYRLYDELINIGYTGPFMYEVSTAQQVKLITRSRELNATDIKNNFNEIVAKKPLTKI